MKEFRCTCPRCGQRFRFDPRLAGRRMSCPRCGGQLVLPPRQGMGQVDPVLPEQPPSDDPGTHLP